jgi:hypothetical protein
VIDGHSIALTHSNLRRPAALFFAIECAAFKRHLSLAVIHAQFHAVGPA